MKRRSSILVAVTMLVFLVSLPAFASADDETPTTPPTTTTTPPTPPTPPKRFGWDPSWRRFDAAEYTLTGAVALSAGALHAFVNPNRVHPYGGPILFDEPLRNAIRAKGREDLERARGAGNLMNLSLLGHTLLIDSFIVPLARGSPELAWQMTWMNAEAFGMSGLTTWMLFRLVGRARPPARECQAGTTDDPSCLSGISSGFPSGHTAGAFTAAGLACAHHSNVALYGGGAPDVIACIGALAVATGAGTMRLVGDRHYATDMLAGAAIGLAAGYAMPTFLHYRARSRDGGVSGEQQSARRLFRIGWSLGAENAPLGASAFGLF